MNQTNIYENARDDMRIKGYTILKNTFSIKSIEHMIEEIEQAVNVDKYYDGNDNIKRIEKIYDKGENLIEANHLILKILAEIYDFEWKLFKDKINSKPPNSEGFVAHYDGIFSFIVGDGINKNGWHEYADQFVTALIAIDDFSTENGPLEIAREDKGTFQELLNNTNKDGTPHLKACYENECNFEILLLSRGDVLIFSSKCPHRSKANQSKLPRRVLYYTYNPASQGDNYSNYFLDKDRSKNPTSKAL